MHNFLVKNKDIYHYERIYSKGLRSWGSAKSSCLVTNLSNEFQLAMKYEGRPMPSSELAKGKKFSYLCEK